MAILPDVLLRMHDVLIKVLSLWSGDLSCDVVVVDLALLLAVNVLLRSVLF